MIIKRLLGIASLLLFTGVAFAAPSSFEVEVDPNPLKVSEFADVTIKAIDDNGNVDTSYNDGDIWIEVEGFEYTDPDVVIPGGGIGFFEASDQGIKIFSKGLTIKKAGTYKLTVVDVYDTAIKGTTEVKVLSDNGGTVLGDLTVTSPSKDSVETTDSVNVVGVTSFPNTPIVIFVDGQEVQEGLSDQKGDFSVIITGLAPGKHTLEVNALDLEDQVIATSGPVPFEYQKEDGPLFVGLDIAPGKEVVVNQKVTFTITTAERVDSALIKVGNDATNVPTTKVEAGKFTKEMALDTPGSYPVSVTLQSEGENKDYSDIDTVVAKDEIRKILSLDNTDDPSKNRSDLFWTYTGSVDYFKVRYGTNKNNLRLSLTTSKPEGTLILADPTKEYYAQVFPVDENGIINGEPSDIIKIGPLKEPEPVCGNGIVEAAEECDDGNIIANDGCTSSCKLEAQPVCGNGVLEKGEECDNGAANSGSSGPGANGCSSSCKILEVEPVAPIEQPAPSQEKSCYPDGIILKTEQINDKYFISWDPIPEAREYIVYRADQAVGSLSQMRIVSRTQNTRFEYPFDVNSEIDKWAWYAVEAVCDETGEQKQVGDITVVKVGPEHTVMILILLALLGFGGWRMIKTTR